MEAITGRMSNAAVPPARTGRVKEPLGMPQAEEREASGFKKEAEDVYIPGRAPEPFGRYWPGTDKEGNPKIYFDDPLQEEGGSHRPNGDFRGDGLPESKSADKERTRSAGDNSEKSSNSPKKTSERCTGNTDKVDREIEKLKKEQEKLKRQIGAETDEEKLRALKAKLLQVESQLRQKDTDAYRRQHTTFQ